jgi:hypothetical protein
VELRNVEEHVKHLEERQTQETAEVPTRVTIDAKETV